MIKGTSSLKDVVSVSVLLLVLLTCIPLVSGGSSSGESTATGEGSGSGSTLFDKAMDFESCLVCLENEYHWCLYPEPSCRDRHEPASNCTVFRSPSTGCFGLVHFNLTETELMVVFVCVCIFGTLMLLVGHKLIKPTLFTVGLISGFIIGATVMYYIMSHTKQLQWPVWVTGLVLGGIFGFCALKFLRVGIALLGAFTGAVFFMLLYGAVQEASSAEYNENWAYGMMAFGGALFGLLAIYQQRRILIVGTSFLGAYAVARSVMFFTKHQINVESALTGGTVADREGPGVVWAYIGGIALLGCLGMWFQFRAIKKKNLVYHKGRYYKDGERIPRERRPRSRRGRDARWYSRSRRDRERYSRVRRNMDSYSSDYYGSDIELAPQQRRRQRQQSQRERQRGGSRDYRDGRDRRSGRSGHGSRRGDRYRDHPSPRESVPPQFVIESDDVLTDPDTDASVEFSVSSGSP